MLPLKEEGWSKPQLAGRPVSLHKLHQANVGVWGTGGVIWGHGEERKAAGKQEVEPGSNLGPRQPGAVQDCLDLQCLCLFKWHRSE